MDVMASQAAGLSLRWFRDRFGAGAEDAETPARLTAKPRSAARFRWFLWAPYLMGERTPHLDPNARGALIGLTASHTRGHIIRAILEGVAFSLKDSFTLFKETGVPVSRIRLGGGGARSSLWRQIQADIYGQEVEIVEAEEGAAYGAAILAGVGAGMWESVDSACDDVVKVAQRIEPQPAAVSRMQESYQAYRRMYGAISSVFLVNFGDRRHNSKIILDFAAHGLRNFEVMAPVTEIMSPKLGKIGFEDFGLLTLHPVELRIETIRPAYELIVCARFDNAAVVEDQHLVRVTDG
jgi:hypothetical protein